METTVDKFGRIVIPHQLREHHGLQPGSVLDIEGREDHIVLHVRGQESHLVVEDGVLVFTGEAEGDLEQAVERQRRERMVGCRS